MHIADYISHVGDFSEETHLHFEKNDTIYQGEMNPLSCFYFNEGAWVRNEIPHEVTRIRIGTNPYECEFRLNNSDADDVQIVLQRTGVSWYIMECGKKDLMRVNGFTKRQMHLKQNMNTVIQVGEMVFLFSTASISSKSPEEHKMNAAVPLNESEYGLGYNGNNINFPLDQVCLIGSDPLCDFYLPGEAFVGMISNLGKRLFLTSLATQSVIVEADGVSAAEKAPLKPGSSINIGQKEIDFKLSKDLRFTQDFNFVPDGKNDCMRLLEIDALGHSGHSYVLPPSGRSVTIGRDSSKCLLAISGSPKISRNHLQAIIYDKSVLIIDNQTTNGTYINGKRIKKRLVHPGDMVKLGDVNFILCFVG
jgi:FHA domain-containing protein